MGDSTEPSRGPSLSYVSVSDFENLQCLWLWSMCASSMVAHGTSCVLCCSEQLCCVAWILLHTYKGNGTVFVSHCTLRLILCMVSLLSIRNSSTISSVCCILCITRLCWICQRDTWPVCVSTEFASLQSIPIITFLFIVVDLPIVQLC